MICVFYAMFSQKKTVEEGTRIKVPTRHSNIPLIGLLSGLLFFILAVAFCLFDEQLKFPFPTFLVYTLCLLALILLIFIKMIFIESKDPRHGVEDEQEQPSHEVDESILFFTLFGSLIAAINLSENFHLDIEFWSSLAGAFTSL